MFVSEINDFKIYNLSAGKTVPEWLTDRRKRSQLLKKVDSRRQIELIQDFEMPGVCTSIRMSPDQQYILAAGTYKPRIKCFEVCNLSIKFERCFDSEVTTFEVISEDYSKIVFMHCDRFIEIHSPNGRHYRLRIPSFGRDMKYHKPTCDLFIVGTTKDIYRLNLERGQFLQPYQSQNSSINVCDVNSEHNLLLVGSNEGVVEAWDPRSKEKCGSLDVALELHGCKTFPSISALKYKNALQIGVGTSSGHVLLYDLRSRNPLFIKDHLNKYPIKRVAFNPNSKAVYSLDDGMLKIWNEETGKQIGYVESTSTFNDFCTIPDTGMIFIGQEDSKMLTYYMPAMGPAPRWCSFLDNLAEEMESEVVENIYDDYQFITPKEVDELHLDHLIGTNLLKAYMHGYFVDVRLYNKAKAAAQPFAFDNFRKEKIREEIQNERKSRLQVHSNLPKVNSELAIQIIEEQNKLSANSKYKKVPSLLEDSRFKAMFENTDFNINKNAEEYKLIAPALNRLNKNRIKENANRKEIAYAEQLHDEEEKHSESSDDDLFGISKDDVRDDSSESSAEEDTKEYTKEMKKAYKTVQKERRVVDSEEPEKNNVKISLNKTIKHNQVNRKLMTLSLQDRIRNIDNNTGTVTQIGNSLGNKQMTFSTKSALSYNNGKREIELKKHMHERKALVRPIKSLKLKKSNLK